MGIIDSPSQAEIGEKDVPLTIEEYVRGFQIPMQYPTAVCVIDRASEFQDQSRSLLGVKLAALVPRRECSAGHHPQGKVRLLFDLADAVDRHNRGVIEFQTRCGFVAETLAFIACGELAAAKHFQRHNSAGRRVPSTENDPHATGAEFTEQLIFAKRDRVDRGLRPLFRERTDRLNGGGEIALQLEELKDLCGMFGVLRTKLRGPGKWPSARGRLS
jgi:hypothetical protein